MACLMIITHTTPVYGDWYFAKDEKHTGCVYLNDKAMYEVDSIACEKRKYISRRNKSGAFINGMPMWKVMKPLYTNFRVKKIQERKAEINVQKRMFVPKKG